MRIFYKCEYESLATNGEIFLNSDKKFKWNKLKIKDIINSNLINFYKQNSTDDKLIAFINDFENLKEFQICYLDLTGKDIHKVIDEINSNKEKETIVYNVVITGRSINKNIWKKYNSASIFF